MNTATQERLARNEAFFREVNEAIEAVADDLGRAGRTYEYLCECSDPRCADRIELSREEYEHIRADSTRFVVVPGHAIAAVEQIVEREDDYDVVEKTGLAGVVAEDSDPREE